MVNDTSAALERKDEAIVLSPFEASTRGVIGYGTTLSLSASQLAVPITDIPASVITINENSIADTAAVDMRDLYMAVIGYNWRNYTVRLRIENIDDDFNTQPSTFYSGIGMTKPLNFRFNITARF